MMKHTLNVLCILAVVVCNFQIALSAEVQVPLPDDGEVEPRCPEVSPIDEANAKMTRLFCSKLKSGKQITADDLKPEYDVLLTKIGTKKYHIGGFYEPLSWYNAVRYCYENKLKLASFDTKEEYQQINHYIQSNYGGMHFWTAGSDLEQYNGKFFWITNGSPVDTSYLTIIPSSLTPAAQAHCLVFNLVPTKFVSEMCKGLSGVLCETI